MSVLKLDFIEKLDDSDKEKVVYFVNLLFQQEKYRHLKAELKKRREEIKKGEILTHEEIWKKLDV